MSSPNRRQQQHEQQGQGQQQPWHWRARPLREELGDIWRTVQRTSLLWPMLFVGVYQVGRC